MSEPEKSPIDRFNDAGQLHYNLTVLTAKTTTFADDVKAFNDKLQEDQKKKGDAHFKDGQFTDQAYIEMAEKLEREVDKLCTQLITERGNEHGKLRLAYLSAALDHAKAAPEDKSKTAGPLDAATTAQNAYDYGKDLSLLSLQEEDRIRNGIFIVADSKLGSFVKKNKEDLLKHNLLDEGQIKEIEEATAKAQANSVLGTTPGKVALGAAILGAGALAFGRKEREVQNDDGSVTTKKKMGFFGKVLVTAGVIGGLFLLDKATGQHAAHVGQKAADAIGTWAGKIRGKGPDAPNPGRA